MELEINPRPSDGERAAIEAALAALAARPEPPLPPDEDEPGE